MLFYSLFCYLVVAVIEIVYIMRVNETDKGMFSWSRDPYNSKRKGFDANYSILFIGVFLMAPFALPLILFAYFSYVIAKRTYKKIFKEEEKDAK